MNNLKLGLQQAYVDRYDASLLQPIPRELSRRHLANTDFFGADLWTAYELSWLAPGGKPQVAIAEFTVPSDSENLIESKSLKYYLNSFNQTEMPSWQKLHECLERDLSAVVGDQVKVQLFDLEAFGERRRAAMPQSILLDALPLDEVIFEPRSDILIPLNEPFTGVWCSHLLKSNCPVTGQPDWASIWVGWQGRAIKPESLLRYIVSYRQHQDFHENCVEKIFTDLASAGQPERLWVYARYTRRGGVDINPLRSSQPIEMPVWLAPRQ